MKKLILLFGMTEILFSIIAIMGLVIIGMAERMRKGYNIEPTKSQTNFNKIKKIIENISLDPKENLSSKKLKFQHQLEVSFLCSIESL